MLRFVIVALVFILGSEVFAREIALTFDDAPRGDSQILMVWNVPGN